MAAVTWAGDTQRPGCIADDRFLDLGGKLLIFGFTRAGAAASTASSGNQRGPSAD